MNLTSAEHRINETKTIKVLYAFLPPKSDQSGHAFINLLNHLHNGGLEVRRIIYHHVVLLSTHWWKERPSIFQQDAAGSCVKQVWRIISPLISLKNHIPPYRHWEVRRADNKERGRNKFGLKVCHQRPHCCGTPCSDAFGTGVDCVRKDHITGVDCMRKDHIGLISFLGNKLMENP